MAKAVKAATKGLACAEREQVRWRRTRRGRTRRRLRRSWERGGASDGIDWTLHLSFLSPSRRFPSFFPHSCRFKLFQTRAPQFCSPIVQQAEERRRRVRAWDGRGCHSKRGGGKRFFFSIEGKYMRSFYLFSRVRACARRGRRASASLMSLSSRLESRNECASQSSNSERATEVTSKKVMERNVFFFSSSVSLALSLQTALSSLALDEPQELGDFRSRSLSLSLYKNRDGPLRRLGGLLGQGEAPRRLDAARGLCKINIDTDVGDID